MKNMKKKLTLVVMLLFLGGTLTTYASKDFTFCFSSNVIGKKGFKLSNKKTTCESRADTFIFNTDNYADFVGKYCIDLEGKGFFKPSYSGTYQKVDGYVHTTKYGKIKKNTYTVNIGSNSHLVPKGGQIKGEGEIVQ